MSPARAISTESAIAVLESRGYVVLKAKSYRQAQERQRVAEALRKYADEYVESNRLWMRHCFDEERRLRDRCTFLYGAARAHGATEDELRGAL